MRTSDTTFRVDGHLFRVTDKGELQYFVQNFEGTGLNGLGGFWKSLKKVVKKVWKPVVAAGAVYLGVKAFSGGGVGVSLPKVSLPSVSTIEKATAIATTVLTAKVASKQAALQNQYGQMPVQTALDTLPVSAGQISPVGMPDANMPQQGNYGMPAGFKPKLDTATMALIGGGALVLILALRK